MPESDDPAPCRIPESVPSDLAAMLTVRYESYEALCRQLYFKLPVFLARHGL